MHTRPIVQSTVRIRVRVRETYLRDFVVPTLRRRAAGAVKLDLLLRALASTPDGERDCMVPPSYGWQQLHDFVRPVVRYKDSPALKRKWVSEQLLTLERADLLRREGSGGRPAIVVLRDDSSGNPLDDPGIEEDTSYVTVHGSLFSQQRVADWGTPQVAAYLAAMIAERYARSDPALAEINRYFAFGNGVWYRPLSWFADPEGLRPANHIRVDFSEKTLGRGIRLLTEQGLMASRRTYHDPRTGERFRSGHTRVLYFNGFAGNSPERNGAEGRRKALLRGSR